MKLELKYTKSNYKLLLFSGYISFLFLFLFFFLCVQTYHSGQENEVLMLCEIKAIFWLSLWGKLCAFFGPASNYRLGYSHFLLMPQSRNTFAKLITIIVSVGQQGQQIKLSKLAVSGGLGLGGKWKWK